VRDSLGRWREEEILIDESTGRVVTDPSEAAKATIVTETKVCDVNVKGQMLDCESNHEDTMLATAVSYIDCGDLYEAILKNGYKDHTRDQQTRRVTFLGKSPTFKKAVERACDRMLARTLLLARKGKVNTSAVQAAKMAYELFVGHPPKNAFEIETETKKEEPKW